MLNRNSIMALSAITLLAGCNHSSMTRPPASMQIQPPAWNEGYRAGCASGKNAAGNPYFSYEKQALRYQNDALYKDGWNSGYDVCKTGYMAIREGV